VLVELALGVGDVVGGPEVVGVVEVEVFLVRGGALGVAVGGVLFDEFGDQAL
jgi:hypothetical protein